MIMSAADRQKFLKDVEGIVCKDRNASYGEPEDSFSLIARFWTNYLEGKGLLNKGAIALTPLDVALLLDLMKTARLCSNPEHFDSLLDKAGYAACAGGMLMTMVQPVGSKDIGKLVEVDPTKPLTEYNSLAPKDFEPPAIKD